MTDDALPRPTPAPPPANDETVHDFEPQPVESDQPVTPKPPRKTRPKQPAEPFSRAYIVVSAVAVIVFVGLLAGFLAMIVLDVPWKPAAPENKPRVASPTDSQTPPAGGGMGMPALGGGRRGSRPQANRASAPTSASSAPRNQTAPAEKK